MGAFETIEARLELASDGFNAAIGNAVQSLGSLESKAGGVHKAVGALGIGLAAVAAGGIAKSVSASMDLQSALTESQAIMGDLTKGEMKAMENAAREVGRTTTFSAAEAGDAFYYLASAGMDAEQSVASMADVAQFAQAGAFDLATATDLATDAQSSLGMASEDAAENAAGLNRVMDVLVKSNTLANASVEQFSEALTNKAGSALKSTNKDIEEGAAVLAAYADQGIKGRLAGERLNIVLRDLQSAAQEDAEAFDALGVSVYDSEGEMRNMADIIADLEQATEGMSTEQKNAALATLGLSQQAQDGITPLLGQSAAIREYESELRNAGGTSEEVAANQLKSLSAQWEILKSQITDIGIGIGNNFLPPLTALVSLLSDAIGVFMRINDATDGWAGTLILLGTLVGGLAMAVGSLSAVIGAGGLAMAVTAASGALAGLGTALAILTGPIGLVIGAIALLAYAWSTNFGGIREQTMRVVRVLRDEFAPAIEWLRGVAARLSVALGGEGGLSGAFASLSATVAPLIEILANGLIVTIRALGVIARAVFSGLSTTFSLFHTAATTAINGVRAVLAPFFNWMSLFWSSHGKIIRQEATLTWQVVSARFRSGTATVRALFSKLVAFVRPAWVAFMSTLRSVTNTTLSAMQRFWSVWGSDIMAIARMVKQTVTTIVQVLMHGISTAIRVGLAAIRGDWAGAWGLIKSYTARMSGEIRRLISGWVTVIVGLFGRLKNRAKNRTRSMMNDLVNIIRGGISKFKRAGRALVTAFANGIKNAAGRAKREARAVVSKVRNLLPGSDAKEGPLSDLSKTGPALVETFADGIASNADRAASAARAVAQAAKAPLEDAGVDIYGQISEKYGETSPGAIREMLERLSWSQRQELADAVASTKWVDKDYQAMASMRKMMGGGVSQSLYDALISRGAGATKLRGLLQEGKRDDGQMVQAEDGSWVPASYYQKQATKAKTPRRKPNRTRQREPEQGITIDFGDLDNDDYVSVGALKQELKEYVKKREHKTIKRATDGDFTVG